MKKLLTILGTGAMLSMAASAAILPCSSGSVTTYTDSGAGDFSCTEATETGQVTYSNFRLVNNFTIGTGGGVLVTPDQLTLTPTGAGTYSFGFQVTAPTAPHGGLYVDTTQQYILVLAYDVTVNAGAGLISTRANVAATTTNGSGNNAGSASLTKDIFYPGSAPNSGGSPNATANVNDQLGVSPTVMFPGGPQNTISARDSLTIQANNNSADVTAFGNAFQQVPEPMMMIPTGLALLGLGFLRRRKTVAAE